jgi:hypothetical protein
MFKLGDNKRVKYPCEKRVQCPDGKGYSIPIKIKRTLRALLDLFGIIIITPFISESKGEFKLK